MAQPEAVIQTRGLRNLGDPSVTKGVVILLVPSAISVVIGARQFGRAVA